MPSPTAVPVSQVEIVELLEALPANIGNLFEEFQLDRFVDQPILAYKLSSTPGECWRYNSINYAKQRPEVIFDDEVKDINWARKNLWGIFVQTDGFDDLTTISSRHKVFLGLLKSKEWVWIEVRSQLLRDGDIPVQHVRLLVVSQISSEEIVAILGIKTLEKLRTLLFRFRKIVEDARGASRFSRADSFSERQQYQITTFFSRISYTRTEHCQEEELTIPADNVTPCNRVLLLARELNSLRVRIWRNEKERLCIHCAYLFEGIACPICSSTDSC